MKTTFAAAGMTALFAMPALAADLPMKAPPMASQAGGINWTGLYVFGGSGGGLWNADSNVVSSGSIFPAGPVTRDQRLGGSGWFGTTGLGYDWQFNRDWVTGVFADGQFGDIKGSVSDPLTIFFGIPLAGMEQLRMSYAAGARLGYLVAPNVLSYVNVGYSGSEWSGAGYSSPFVGGPGTVGFTTPSFHRDGWFVGGGVENSFDILGIKMPGWFMKTEYRAAHYDRGSLSETNAVSFLGLAPGATTGSAVTFKPWVQTISTSLVYRFDSDRPTASAPVFAKASAPVAAVNWTGFYLFGGGGGGLWAADGNVVASSMVGFSDGAPLTNDLRSGGHGWFGTVGAGYDWQFAKWVAGILADAQFGDISGSIGDPSGPEPGGQFEGREKLRASYAAGARLGYLVAPNVLSYVNAGYTGSEWSGATYSLLPTVFGLGAAPPSFTTPSFRRGGWFVGGGVENDLSTFGIAAPGWFMKTEYRAAHYNRVTLPETFIGGLRGGSPTGDAVTFKPWTQTISTSLVYRFNTPLAAKY